MLKDIITEQGYTVYRVSKDTGIPYSTLVDLVSGKTSMENTSAGTLNRLSAYLNMSMERIYHSNDPSSLIYLYNEGRTVHVDFQDYKMEYLGPKNLVAFKRINRVQNGMICVDTYFYDTDNTIYTEEDYVDLTDVFGDYDLEGILPEKPIVIIGNQDGTNFESTLAKHPQDMIKTIVNYRNSVDKEILVFVNNIIHGNQTSPITVCYLSESQCDQITSLSERKIPMFSPRCILDADAVRHIIKRHGPNGKSDHSMSDINDIARMSYVLTNYDDVLFEGTYSKKKYKCRDGSPAPHIVFKKRIDGTYYIIEAISDAASGLSHIVSAYIS